MSHIRKALLVAAVVIAGGCSFGPSDAWLATCVEDWRAIYAKHDNPWPGDIDMRSWCRQEWEWRYGN